MNGLNLKYASVCKIDYDEVKIVLKIISMLKKLIEARGRCSDRFLIKKRILGPCLTDLSKHISKGGAFSWTLINS